jgi:hypothetical protein
MRAATLFTIVLLAGGCQQSRTREIPEDATCSEVGQWALVACRNGSDMVRCEGVYTEAVEACRADLAEGRRVCVPEVNLAYGCAAWVVPPEGSG